MGVLKGASLPDALVTGLLCVALVPLGVRMLRGRLPAPAGASGGAELVNRGSWAVAW
ncbi:hypothetical protein GCM10020220_000040 [Nonomuraea rubra]|uniref:hypothetical protein n=1 Tax=Nonomuraea rubra TaxID=46180 RepID=UPI0031E7D5D4